MEPVESFAGSWDVTGQPSSRGTGGNGKTWVGWREKTGGSGLCVGRAGECKQRDMATETNARARL